MVNVCVSIFIICTHVMYVIICGWVYTSVCMWSVNVYGCMFVQVHVFSCVLQWLRTRMWSELGNRRFRFVHVMDPVYWRFKDHPWDHSEIRSGSFSEDQMAIQTQNLVISFECLFLYIFPMLPVGVHVAIRVISCDYLIYLPVWLPVSLHKISVSTL